jgi:hypothetical protein
MGDALEAAVLRAWRHALPPVLVPKAVLGEYGGALLAGALLAAQGRPFGPTPYFTGPDDVHGLVPHDGRPLRPPARLLVTALASGGAATWMVLRAEGR